MKTPRSRGEAFSKNLGEVLGFVKEHYIGSGSQDAMDRLLSQAGRGRADSVPGRPSADSCPASSRAGGTCAAAPVHDASRAQGGGASGLPHLGTTPPAERSRHRPPLAPLAILGPTPAGRTSHSTSARRIEPPAPPGRHPPAPGYLSLAPQGYEAASSRPIPGSLSTLPAFLHPPAVATPPPPRGRFPRYRCSPAFVQHHSPVLPAVRPPVTRHGDRSRATSMPPLPPASSHRVPSRSSWSTTKSSPTTQLPPGLMSMIPQAQPA